jgi:alkylation response protein AidB-like acyl-CoA dehydrogenase
MPAYRAPVKDTQFVLETIVGLEKYSNLPTFGQATPDVVKAILEEGGKFCENVLAPINLSGDIEGCTRHDDGSVSTPAGFKAAYDQFVEAGWGTLMADEAHGGQGLPYVVGTAFSEYMSSSNMAFGMYPASMKAPRPRSRRSVATIRSTSSCPTWSRAYGPAR